MNKTDEQIRIDNLKAIEKLQALHTLRILAQQLEKGLNDFKATAIRSYYKPDSICIEMLKESLESFHHVGEMIEDELNDLKEEREQAA